MYTYIYRFSSQHSATLQEQDRSDDQQLMLLLIGTAVGTALHVMSVTNRSEVLRSSGKPQTLTTSASLARPKNQTVGMDGLLRGNASYIIQRGFMLMDTTETN